MEAEATEQRIEKVGAKIATLERRVEQLEHDIANPQKSDGSKSFARAERGAINAGITALKWHRSEVEGIGDVVDALRRLVCALEAGAGVEHAKFDAMDALKEWEDT